MLDLVSDTVDEIVLGTSDALGDPLGVSDGLLLKGDELALRTPDIVGGTLLLGLTDGSLEGVALMIGT